MFHTRTTIAEHLAISNKLGIAVREVEGMGLSIRYVAKKYGLKYLDLYKKKEIRMLKRIFEYERRQFEGAAKDFLQEGLTYSSVVMRYGTFDRAMLHHEITKARNEGLENYKYDKPKRGDQMIFTYVEEETLLEFLINWKSASSQTTCTCQLCALVHLLTLVRELAQHKNIGWPSDLGGNLITIVEIDWLKAFEMSFSEEISRSFSPMETCTKRTDESADE